jgi:nitroreductase
MNKKPEIDSKSAPLLPEIAERWSPRAFEPNSPLSESELASLLEAYRWAPSSGNNQPWKIAVIQSEDAGFNEFVEHGLMAGNAIWAKNSSALFVLIANTVDDSGNPLDRALFSSGMAAAQLQLQAQYLGLHSHHMSGIHTDWISKKLSLGDSMVINSVLAVGRQAAAETLDEALKTREEAPRTRKPLAEIVISAK